MKPKTFNILSLFIFFCTLSFYTTAQEMTNTKIGEVVQELTDTVAGSDGFWELTINDMKLTIISDEANNRMRIITPIAYLTDIDGNMLKKAMEANFHRALDIKYCVSDEIMWSAYIHPLKELSEDQLKDAIAQVYFGSLTFGGSYSSTNLTFPKSTEPRSE
ncbi:MAG: hypothetical protein ACI8XB_000282 [Patiriisocius sp.]|jgi:hypothetical protein